LGTALALAAATAVWVVAAVTTTAQAATNGFSGVNWADQRDNFVNDTLVLGGLSTSDTYATTQAKADRILSGFQANLGANTVRLPVNYPTVSGSYWNSYIGAIDTATAKGMKVILSYWEADSSRDGLVDDTTQFWAMWQKIVTKYSGNGLVHFEPMNEPHGYSDANWKNLAAQWLTTYPGVPRGRIIISGAGYNQRLATIGGDSRFDGTLISLHTYAFFNSSLTSELQWRQHVRDSVGGYAARVLITEWGAPMTDGRNYDQPSLSDSFVAFVRGVAAEARSLGLGTVYWPGVRVNDWYRLQEINGSGTGITLSTTSASGRDQLRYSWGISDSLPPTPASVHHRVVNRNSGRVMDVIGASAAANAEVKQYAWNGGENQQWYFEDAGGGYYQLVARHSGKCLDVSGSGTGDGADIQQYACHSGTNQQWSRVQS
jgi:hypothetical protein